MAQHIDIQNLISTSTQETFKQNLKKAVEKNVPIGERLTLYNYIVRDIQDSTIKALAGKYRDRVSSCSDLDRAKEIAMIEAMSGKYGLSD